jgi:hypothetical protein
VVRPAIVAQLWRPEEKKNKKNIINDWMRHSNKKIDRQRRQPDAKLAHQKNDAEMVRRRFNLDKIGDAPEKAQANEQDEIGIRREKKKIDEHVLFFGHFQKR